MNTETLEIVIKKSYADKYGHVNYKKYLDLFRRGQNNFAKKRGIDFGEIEETYGLRSVIRKMSIEYLGEVFPSDRVSIKTRVEKVGNSSFTYSQEILRGEKTVTLFLTVVVMIDKNGKPASIPQDIHSKLLT
ncbi:MAG: acyl-CoA thioesterase [Parcubacteria group bacterium]|nr:acyl-CoA thioesterase [Parcubacteria group bacterium]